MQILFLSRQAIYEGADGIQRQKELEGLVKLFLRRSIE
jgi:hypothetical protein